MDTLQSNYTMTMSQALTQPIKSYMYTAQRGIGLKAKFIGGCLKARNQVEAYANARVLVRERGGNVTQLLVNKL